MKTLKIVAMTTAVLLFTAAAVNAEQQQSAEEQEMMKKWMAYATPGAGHKFLNHLVGEWETHMKSWMKPGEEPTVTKGEAKGKLILGGRYLKVAHKGTVMGMPFEGFSIGGFDNFTKKYFATWVDNMGTGIMLSRGTLDASGKVLTETSEVDDIFTGEKVRTRQVTTILSADKIKFEMFMGPAEKEFKNMELFYVRKKN